MSNSLSLTWSSATSQMGEEKEELVFVEICWVPFIPGLLVYSFSCNHHASLQDRLVNYEGEFKC